MAQGCKGTKGYADQAEQLFDRYNKLSFNEVHAAVLDLIPRSPAQILDIGAGAGNDAACFADMGHRVVAVEPTDELRIRAIRHHKSPLIDWIDDGLPDLGCVMRRAEQFDLIMLTGVWMHLDALERQTAMPVLSSLLAPAGLIIMSLRHGPAPSGRLMFDVSAEETVGLASRERLTIIRNVNANSIQMGNRAAGITWTHLAFEKERVSV
jgi:protein-L-isoaspartate O-methyltransferase